MLVVLCSDWRTASALHEKSWVWNLRPASYGTRRRRRAQGVRTTLARWVRFKYTTHQTDNHLDDLYPNFPFPDVEHDLHSTDLN